MEAFSRARAQFVVDAAHKHLSWEEFRRMVLILKHWKSGCIRQSVAEYMLCDMCSSHVELHGYISEYIDWIHLPYEHREIVVLMHDELCMLTQMGRQLSTM